jgi:hypothetical protein
MSRPVPPGIGHPVCTRNVSQTWDQRPTGGPSSSRTVEPVASLSRALILLLRGEPWFVRRPRLTVGVAVAMYVAIIATRILLGTPADDVYLLFALPIALIAVAFGMRAGVFAGLTGVVLIILWAQYGGIDLSVIGWASRISPMLLLGYLLGDAIDRLRRAENERRRLEASARRQRDAIEINDTIVQGLSAAKWALESGDLDQGLTIVSDTLTLGHRLVSELIRDADMQRSWSGTPDEPSQDVSASGTSYGRRHQTG